jgi:predicted enzyme related to lactoylglutathione lyase
MAEAPRGRFGWYELFTSDTKAAKTFYCDVVGWTTGAWGEGDKPYTMWIAGEASIGGLLTLPTEIVGAVPPHWIAYITTPDADGTIARTEALGGKAVWGPMNIPDVGRVAGLTDPQGAHFAIIRPAGDAPGKDDPAGIGEISWHELATTGWEDAWAFYSELFDWQKTDTMDMGELGTYQMFGRGAHPLGGMYDKPPQIPVVHWLLYVRVEDIGAALERVSAGGGTVLNGPEDVPGGGKIAQCMDPQGAVFALHWGPEG